MSPSFLIAVVIIEAYGGCAAGVLGFATFLALEAAGVDMVVCVESMNPMICSDGCLSIYEDSGGLNRELATAGWCLGHCNLCFLLNFKCPFHINISKVNV